MPAGEITTQGSEIAFFYRHDILSKRHH